MLKVLKDLLQSSHNRILVKKNQVCTHTNFRKSMSNYLSRFSLFLFLLSLSSMAFPVFGQVRGKITSPSGSPLAFATVYAKGTTLGTTSNEEGNYNLQLPSGNYELEFQYLGYRPEVRRVEVEGQPIQLDIVLREEALDLQEVVVRADEEDPAYPIIRKAMEKRKYYRDQVEAYECEVYVKGNIKFLDAPERIFGVEVGDLGGSLDSNRQGIVYLSESISRLQFQLPDQFNEEMLSNKVSGNDNGFSFNRASQMDFNLYESYADFGRKIVSPIAGNAFGFYKYRLVGTLLGDDGQLINKIEIIPKRSEDPVYRGFIYIADDYWNIQQADLLLTKGAMKIDALDSLSIQQVYVPVAEPDVWRLFSQHMTFKIGILAFKLQGAFTGVYSKYDLQPQLEKQDFRGEVFRVEEGTNEMPMEFWDTIRPIPLTLEEEVDYVRKDSIQEVRESKVYLDSVDRRNNRFQFINLLGGYVYSNSYNDWYLQISSPLTTLQFNTIQGWNLETEALFQKDFGKYETRSVEVRAGLNYGFSDRRLRWFGSTAYQFDQIYRTRLEVTGGVDVFQFNRENPISPTLNSLYSLFGRRNFIRLYEKSFGKVAFVREIFNGVRLFTDLEYAQRKALVNQSDYSFGDQERKPYSSNDPQDPLNFDPAFPTHEAFIWNVALRIRIGQRYITYPKRRFLIGSNWPDIWLIYRKGILLGNADIDFDQFLIRLEDRNIPTGAAGYLQFRAEGGHFLRRENLFFMDFQHFNGNKTLFGNPSRYLRSFLLLPYYTNSTSNYHVQAFMEHHFEGYILDKIPGIRKLGWKMVVGGGFLFTPEQRDYLELRVGIENIGWNIFRFLRIDGAFSRDVSGNWDGGVLLGLSLPGG